MSGAKGRVAGRITLMLVACLPLTFVATFALLPLWRWVEEVLGIEAVGHSGPSEWCFYLIYGILALTGIGLSLRRGQAAPPTAGA